MNQSPIVITSGEPAGIGPDLLIQVVQKALPFNPVIIANTKLLKQRAELLDLPLNIILYSKNRKQSAHQAGSLQIIDIPLTNHVIAGQLDSANANYVITMLDRAIEGCLSGEFSAITTAPVQKSIINDAGIPFTGHTEFLAEKTGTSRVVMMLASSNLKVALATTHIPLSEVPAAIQKKTLIETLHILHNSLQKQFAITKPRIFIAGLNPHAGEGGHIGREEIEIIEPVIAQLKAEGLNLTGPLSADTLFTQERLKACDAILSMYHDQALPVLKAQGFGEAVNITLGLPILRTSVDHGTALELAGTSRAETGSLLTAINMANEMASNRNAP